MKIHPDQLDTLELTCKKCKEVKTAREMKLHYRKNGNVFVELKCKACINAQHREQNKCVNGSRYTQYALDWLKERELKKRAEVQARLKKIKEAGFSLNKESDCAKIVALVERETDDM